MANTKNANNQNEDYRLNAHQFAEYVRRRLRDKALEAVDNVRDQLRTKKEA